MMAATESEMKRDEHAFRILKILIMNANVAKFWIDPIPALNDPVLCIGKASLSYPHLP